MGPRTGGYNITTLLVSTLIVTGIAMILAVPLGLCSAVYLSEYAKPRTRQVLKPILEVLAGIPSVVVGVRPDLHRPRGRRPHLRRGAAAPAA